MPPKSVELFGRGGSSDQSQIEGTDASGFADVDENMAYAMCRRWWDLEPFRL